ncbi:preprotein translocase subunit SecG [bacterium]|nr:preprotein translocase subunit SecG [bacterium]
MHSLIIVIHVIVCITMILIIIFQTSKGSEMGAVFGGGASQTAFGSAGPQDFLEKVTVVCAVIFMLTSLTLAYMSATMTNRLIEEPAPIERPVAPMEQPLQQGQQPMEQPAHEGQPFEQQGQQPASPVDAPVN